MNTINNDINRFDAKYLKCVISKYPSVLNFLANSGAMIVLQPQNEISGQDIKETYDRTTGEYEITVVDSDDHQRNYIYLGNEFLASGYGFSTVQYRNTGERIIKSFDSIIKALKKADADETKARDDKDKEIIDEFKKYVAIDGGRIENTVINFDGDNTRKIKTRDIILYGEEAQYEDLKVEDINISLYDNNGFKYEAKNGECIFPFGAVVASISVEIVGKDNDSGGLNYLEVLHDFYNQYSNYDENEGIIIKYDADVDNKVVIDDNIDSKYNLHKWYYFKQLTSSSVTELIIDNDKNNVIKDIYLYIKKTPSTNYKFYPGLLNCKYIGTNDPVKLVSSGNAIKDHKISLGTRLNIKSQYYIQYNFNKNLSLNYFNDDNIAPLNLIDENDTTIINIQLNHNSTDVYKHFQVAVPVNFALRKFYLVKNNTEKFNLTGAVRKIKSNVSMPCPKSKVPANNDNTYYCIKYDLYKFDCDSGENDFEAPYIAQNVNICLEVVYDGKTKLNIINETQSDLNNNFINNIVNDEIINDEEFNNLYWVNGNSILMENLSKTQENGIYKVTNNENNEGEHEINQYIVTFNSNGGSSIGTRNVNSGSSIGVLPTPIREGYTFNGWYTEQNNGTVILPSTIITSDIEIYAHWINNDNGHQDEPTGQTEPEPTGNYYWYAGAGPITSMTIPGSDANWHAISGRPTSIETGELSNGNVKINWVLAIPTDLGLNHISNGVLDVTSGYDESTIECGDGVGYKVFTQISQSKKTDRIFVE